MFEKNFWLVMISKNLAFGTPYCKLYLQLSKSFVMNVTIFSPHEMQEQFQYWPY